VELPFGLNDEYWTTSSHVLCQLASDLHEVVEERLRTLRLGLLGHRITITS